MTTTTLVGLVATDDLVVRLVLVQGESSADTLIIPVSPDDLTILGNPRVLTGLDVWGLPGDLNYVIARRSVTGAVVIRRIRASARRIL